MGIKKCMKCKGKGFDLLEVKDAPTALITLIVRDGKVKAFCTYCKGKGFTNTHF